MLRMLTRHFPLLSSHPPTGFPAVDQAAERHSAGIAGRSWSWIGVGVV